MRNIYRSLREKFGDSVYRQKLVHTFTIFYTFIAVGICASQTGPSLLDLQLITNTDTEQSAVFLTGGSVGSMIGSLIMGFLFGRFNKVLLMSGTLLCAAVTVTALPWASIYVLMILMHGLVAIFRAGFTTGGNTYIIRTWEDERRVFVQLLHFSFALGGTLAPLITQPFLAPRTNSTSSEQINSTEPIPLTVACTRNISDSQYPFCDHPETRIQYAYLISGILFLLASILFFIQNFCYKKVEENSSKPSGEYESLEKPLPLGIYVVTLGTILLIFFFLIAIESSMASFILTFVVTYLDWSKTAGANLTSVFWACHAAMRFGAIFFTEYVSPFVILVVTSLLVLVSGVGGLVSSTNQSDTGVWICISLSGLALATQFPAAITWAEESIMRLSPRIVSLIVFACTFPGVVNPLVLGHLMQVVTPLWLFYLTSIECGISLVLILFLYTWNKFVVQPTTRRLNSTTVEVAADDRVKL